MFRLANLSLKHCTRYLVPVLLVVFAVWAVCACMGWGGQRTLFFEEGRQELYDFWMPRMCLEQGYVGGPELSDWRETPEGRVFVTGTMDKVYPAFALLPFRMFPASRAGGWCWSALAGAFFLACLVLVARTRGTGRWWPLALMASMPFLYNLERGNPVWLSAALCGVYLAWWDDVKPGRRIAAALCLAVAAVLKIAPAALGLLYVAECVRLWRAGGWAAARKALRLPLLAAAVALVLFVLPWLLVSDGLSGIPVMLSHAAHHAEAVLRMADFGFVQVWRTLRILLGQDVGVPWTGMMAVARLSQVLGFLSLVAGAWRRSGILLVGGMLLAAGNMYYYAALYLFPVLVLERLAAQKGARCLLWFAILCPLQLVWAGHTGNTVLCNVALMAMMADGLRPSDER